MQFNSQADNLDLYSEARRWCGIDLTDTTSYPLKEFAMSCNFALDRLHMIILRADGRWQHDDQNNSSTELLDTSTSFSSAARKYAIPITWLKIHHIEIQTPDGTYKVLPPSDRRHWSRSEINGESGEPTSYELLGRWVYFNKTPNYSGTMRVVLQKGPSYFDDGDTTKEPGFASPFHRLVALHGALDYCEINDLDGRATKLRSKIGTPPTENGEGSGLEKELHDFYATRNVDDRPAVGVRQEDYGQSALGDGTGFHSNNPHGF